MVPAENPAPNAVVVGSGPNGLAAATALAQAGIALMVLEAESTIGGGARSAELTLPGFTHDICSAVHPFAIASPFFRTLPLREYGLEWVHPLSPLAHPLDDGSVVMLERSMETTASGLGEDALAYKRLLGPLLEDWDGLVGDVFAPPHWPRHPLRLAGFGMKAIRSAYGFASSYFRGDRARALFAGLAAHSILPLENAGTAAFGLILAGAAHGAGWPFPRGGAQRITDALASYLRSLGGSVVTGTKVGSLNELPPASAVICDITPRQLLRIAGERLPEQFRRKLGSFRYGPGVFKVDWALDGPIPWTAAECSRAGTVHLGGTMSEIAACERAVSVGKTPNRPFVLLSQPSLFDPTRAPAGAHTAWAYCHVPNGSSADMLEPLEAQVERFAPGFRRRVIGRSVMSPAKLEQQNANLVGGDITGGAADLRQLFFRPTAQLYSTPVPGLFLCSASTPPGGGVHGMCGFYAAQRALKYLRKQQQAASSKP
ncbi:MAG: NAD(P)/FAD-dependent oxidoreductase [Terriglobales bacterium]